ncbi:MAG: NUDIX hydrolase [Dysgonomonas sp.]
MKKIDLTHLATTTDSVQDSYHPGFSIHCVILGFHSGKLKILLNKFEHFKNWMLPGDLVHINESVDNAATRILMQRTGLADLFFRQFYLFGNTDRDSKKEIDVFLKEIGMTDSDLQNHWMNKRFISVGYYALANFHEAKTTTIFKNEKIKWFDLENLPDLYADHYKIVMQAIETIRFHIGHIPLGYELLPEKFTIPELRIIYETILGKSLNRRNFQRKILSVGLVRKLEDENTCNRPKQSPLLYSFIKEQYNMALDYGVPLMSWSLKDL